MKSNFTSCSIESPISTQYKDHVNLPINLNLCISVRKIQYSRYPDNYGVPAILFDTLGEDIKWLFNSVKERDIEFKWITTGEVTI